MTYVTRNCRHCDAEFVVPEWYGARDRRGLFCSRECLNESQRRKPTTCSVCGAPVSRAVRRRARTCGRPECVTEAKARAKRGPANPNYLGEEGAKARWFAAAADRCEWCGGRRLRVADGRLCQHHVIYRQAIRAEGGDTWDPRNALTLCVACHTRHHRSGGEGRLPLIRLRDANYEYARDLLGPPAAYEYLRRRYTGIDPRLSALLATEAA